MASPQHAYRRIAEKVQAPLPVRAGWSPPPVQDLIARIDAALLARRAS